MTIVFLPVNFLARGASSILSPYVGVDQSIAFGSQQLFERSILTYLACLPENCCADQGVDVLRLPVDKIPVILHAEYAAGIQFDPSLHCFTPSIMIYLNAEPSF